jgi:hypothetical protein
METVEEYQEKLEKRKQIIEFFAKHKVICKEIEPHYFLVCWQQKTAITTIVVIPKKGEFRTLLSLNFIKLNHVGDMQAAKRLTGLEPVLNQPKKMLKLLKSMKELTSKFAKESGVNNPANEVRSLKKQGHIISTIPIERTYSGQKRYLSSYIYIGDGAGTKNIIT